MENAFSPVVAVPAATSAVRPKSAGSFPSRARKLLVPATSGFSATRSAASPSSPFCTRYRNRPRLVGPSARSERPSSAAACAIRQPPTNVNPVYTAPTTLTVVRPRTASNGIARQVVKEEIELQRQVKQDAQKQLTAVQRELSAREKEIEALQLQLDKIREQRQPVLANHTPRRNDDKGVEVSPEVEENGSSATGATPRTPKPRVSHQDPVIPALEQQLANHDGYKKQLRHMLDRLMRNVQAVTAGEELLRQQTAGARREQVVFAEKLAQDQNQCRDLESKRARILRERAAFAQDSDLLLATYRDEITARTTVSAQRQVADRRRRNMLQLLESRPSSVSSSGNGAAHASARQDNSSEATHRSRRRNSCSILAADTNGRRESIFELYEAQYDRILSETGESDAIRVLETFLGFAESQSRLIQIEQELVTETSHLEREREAHEVLLHHLRASGTAEVEKRKKIRDYLEHVMHERQLEKQFAKEALGESAKLFIYIQQGVLNIAELLRCLEDSAMATGISNEPWAAASSAIIGKARIPIVTGAASVTDAANTLAGLVHRTLLVLRGYPTAPRPIEFSTEQIDSLAKFMPEFEQTRLAHYTAPGIITRSNNRSKVESVSQPEVTLNEKSTVEKADHTEIDETEQLDLELARYNVKQFEKETLLEVDALFRTIDAKKKRQATTRVLAASMAAEGSHEGRAQSHSSAQPKHTTAGRSRHQSVGEDDILTNLPPSALPVSDPDMDMKEKLEAVHIFFREKRKYDKLHGVDSRQSTITAAVVDSKAVSKSKPPSRPLGAASTAIAGVMMNRKMLVKQRSADILAPPATLDSTTSSNKQQSAAETNSAQPLATGDSKGITSSTPKVPIPTLKRKGSTRTARPRPFR